MRNAIVTASYAPDFERCRILCETIDRQATGYDCHYILVDAPDADLFRQLEGPKRRVVLDTELLPWWLKRMPAALSPGGRRLWLSPVTAPLHGWHVQQLKRIAIAAHVEEDGLLYCDSDTALVKPFDVDSIWEGDDIRFFREQDAPTDADHPRWVRHTARALGLRGDIRNDSSYVTTFLAWKRRTVLDMCDHIERTHHRPWISVVGSTRKFSECTLYGWFVDEVLQGEGHAATSTMLCPMKWADPTPSEAELEAFIAELQPEQVAVGVQSFIPMDVEKFRSVVVDADTRMAVPA